MIIEEGQIVLCPLCKGGGVCFYEVLVLPHLSRSIVDDKKDIESELCPKCKGEGRLIVRLEKMRQGS